MESEARAARWVRFTYLHEWSLFYSRLQGTPANTLPGPSIRRMWDAGADNTIDIVRSVWFRVARLTLASYANPRYLVRAMFDNMQEFQPPPPSELLRPELLYEESRYADLRLRDLRQRLASSELAMQAEYHVRRPHTPDSMLWRAVIVAGDQEYGPLFRWAMANQQGLRDVADDYRSWAIPEYSRDSEFYDQLPLPLPEEFRAAGRAYLLQRCDQLCGPMDRWLPVVAST